MSENDVIVYVDPDIEDLIPGFLDNRRKDVKDIRKYLEEGNLSEIQRIGHNMSGSGSGYGFDEISRIGKSMEAASKNKDKDEITGLNDRLERYLSVVKVEIGE